MKDKKGQMSSAFTYIFAIIVGGTVFVFLIAFAYQYLALSGSLGAAELVVSLNDEFSAFSVSESAEKVIDYDRNLDFRIIQGLLSSGGQAKPIDHIIFAPFQLQGKEIYMATKTVELPYKVGNVFYLEDGNTIYVLVYDDVTEEVVDDLKNSFYSLPKNFASEIYSIDQVTSNIGLLQETTAGYERVRFVFFTDYDSVLDDISLYFENYEILRVTSSEEDYSYGEVQFPDKEVIYLDFSLLIGAIISADADSYQYNFDQVLNKLSVVTNVYYDKSKFVSARLPECDYNAIKVSLNNYKAFIGSTDSYVSYKIKADALEDVNKNFGGDCPEIF
jgi:hypothetical protein